MTANNKLVFFVNGKKTRDCSPKSGTVPPKSGRVVTLILTYHRKLPAPIQFYLNLAVEDGNIDPEWTLLYYLRKKLRLCGTKLGCGEGGCGACTVMVSKYDRTNHKEIHIPVNACLAPVCSMHGLSVTTVEGIGSTRSKLHPVQERIAKAHGSQCGFCTPGIVMSMYALLRQNNKPKMSDMEEAFQGNLCRCTGYRPIIEGYKTFTEEWEHKRIISDSATGNCRMGNKCCKLQNDKSNSHEQQEELFNSKEFGLYNSSQEPIFPPELKLNDIYDKEFLKFEGPSVIWYRPTTLEQLFDLKSKHPNAKLVVGNTEIGIETKFKNMHYPVLIQPTQIADLSQITETPEGIKIGAAATLTDIKTYLDRIIKDRLEEKTRIFKAFNKMLLRFAGKQIRSVGCLGGNILTGSPISDLVPILMACSAKLEIASKTERSKIVLLDDNFYTGYRKTILSSQEVLISILLPFSHKNQYFEAFKQSRRHDDDIAIVNMAVNVTFEKNFNLIDCIYLGVGGMAFKTVNAPKTQKLLRGLPWTTDTLNLAHLALLEDLPLDPSAPGGMVRYRRSLALGLFTKIFLAVSEKLQQITPSSIIEKRDLSGADEFGYTEYESSQYFSIVPGNQPNEDSVQRPIVHTAAYKQASGEAIYVDDMPSFENELYIAFVLSERAHANIISIDADEALRMEGVLGLLTDNDVDENQNSTGFLFDGDEKIFYSKKVTSIGQIIAVIVAKDQLTAQKAVKKVKITYENIEPIIVTIEDAVKHGSFFEEFPSVSYGQVDEYFEMAKHKIKGKCKTGNQKNFYLETQSVLCVPKEEGGMEIYSSTQCPMDLLKHASKFLKIPMNKISVITKRLGGGFGGKEWKSVLLALLASLAANEFQQPVRCMLDRDEDMVLVGGRPSYLFEYNVGFDDEGKISSCDVNVFTNGGYSLECTALSLGKTLSHLDNAFNMPNFRAKGKICRTNIPSNSAMRGFGGPEATFASLCIIDDISEYLKKDFIDVIKINLYNEGDLTYYKQEVDVNLRRCFNECFEKSKFDELKRKAEKFNNENRFKKRGVAITPSKFGIGLEAEVPSFSQAAALVNVYTDGSVLLHHGGVEMGQGLHTKLIQIATRIFKIPADKIYTDSIATNIVPNCSATVASKSSDLFGPAVIDACTKIIERLKPFKEANPTGTWESWVTQAYLNKVSLSATGFYRSESTNEYDAVTQTGKMFDYFVHGAGCSEVEIDTLTGDHQVLSTTLVMDLGESLNPAIDVGQIEGAFMQGYGLFVMEESVFSPDGQLYTKGPGTYKIPGFSDIPRKFNVSLLKGSSNPRAVYSSKAVGEPPLGLATSVFFAIKDAIKAARRDNGVSTTFTLDAPATAEKIRMACLDEIIEKIPVPTNGSYTPWSVVS